MTVWIYVDTTKQGPETAITSRFSRNAGAAETWFAENDPEGVAFECEILPYVGNPT